MQVRSRKLTLLFMTILLTFYFRPAVSTSVEEARRFMAQWRAYLANLTARDLITERDWQRFNVFNRLFQEYLNRLELSSTTPRA